MIKFFIILLGFSALHLTLPFNTETSSTSGRIGMNLAATFGSATPSSPPMKVAVIGAGAAGLVTARVLKRNGIEPIILEKDAKDTGVGGVWSYKSNSDSRPMYRGLRTNLPRELMAYREYPWGGDGKTTSFVTHEEVKDYLKRYAKAMDIEDFIQYDSTVTHLEILKGEESKSDTCEKSQEWPRIKLEWESGRSNDMDITTHSDDFDAVCVCNGHYAAPANPVIPGIENFEGEIIHSITYDDPSIFKDKKVLCVGGRASGSDLAREISRYAKHVYLSDTTCPPLTDGQPMTENNVSWVSRTTEILPNSRVSFGSTCDDTPEVDIIIFCSGYDYKFPFITEHSNLDLSVVSGERRVKPLYEHLWHARYPSLTFIGLQHSVVPFPYFELQAEAVVSQLVGDSSSKSWTLPSLDVRMDSAENDANSGGPNTPGRVQDTHYLGSYQWDRCLKYAKFAGVCNDSLQKYIMTNKALYNHSGEQRKDLFPGGFDSYRYNSYVRDDENESFRVTSLHREMGFESTPVRISSDSTVPVR